MLQGPRNEAALLGWGNLKHSGMQREEVKGTWLQVPAVLYYLFRVQLPHLSKEHNIQTYLFHLIGFLWYQLGRDFKVLWNLLYCADVRGLACVSVRTFPPVAKRERTVFLSYHSWLYAPPPPGPQAFFPFYFYTSNASNDVLPECFELDEGVRKKKKIKRT